MPNWKESMQQTFEYYIVDPGTWQDDKQLTNVKSCTIKRDAEAETLGSATIDVTDSIGEAYVRIYLVTIQNGVTEKHPLGTFLVQTPSLSYDGKSKTISLDAYTPLMELKENSPPIGYSILKGENIMDKVYRLTSENVRSPTIEARSNATLFYNFVADLDNKWLTFLSDLMSNAKYKFDLDEMGRILYAPKQDTASLQPIFTYDAGNSSILHPDITVDRDLYGVPNVVEVVYSNGSGYYYAKAVNDDPNSPISTLSRGREIKQRITDPDLIGNPTENRIKEYAEQCLRDLSALEYTVTYTHAYVPVRVGDCVRLDCKEAGLDNVKAKVVSQSIKCELGCPVTEKSVFTIKLWG